MDKHFDQLSKTYNNYLQNPNRENFNSFINAIQQFLAELNFDGVSIYVEGEENFTQLSPREKSLDLITRAIALMTIAKDYNDSQFDRARTVFEFVIGKGK